MRAVSLSVGVVFFLSLTWGSLAERYEAVDSGFRYGQIRGPEGVKEYRITSADPRVRFELDDNGVAMLACDVCGLRRHARWIVNVKAFRAPPDPNAELWFPAYSLMSERLLKEFGTTPTGMYWRLKTPGMRGLAAEYVRGGREDHRFAAMIVTDGCVALTGMLARPIGGHVSLPVPPRGVIEDTLPILSSLRVEPVELGSTRLLTRDLKRPPRKPASRLPPPPSLTTIFQPKRAQRAPPVGDWGYVSQPVSEFLKGLGLPQPKEPG